MAEPVEDVSSLPGRKVSDQTGVPIGEVEHVYATEEGFPMWVSVQISTGVAGKRTVFVALARLKEEKGELRVPYTKSRILEAPEVDAQDGISEECDEALRHFYGIGAGDQELMSDNKSYATLVTESTGKASRVDDLEQLETPDGDKRTEETKERVNNPGSSEMRDVNADDVAAESGTAAVGRSKGKQDTSDGD